MSSFWQDLRYAGRTLLRTPGFTAIVVLVLALGIGANSAIFSVVNAVLLRPLPYVEPGKLYHLDEINPKGQPEGISPADIQVYQKHTRVFEKLAVTQWQNLTLTGPEGQENVYGLLVSSDCLPMLGTPPALGRIFREDEFRPGAPGAVILSDKLWRRRFAGDPRVIGRQVMMNGQSYTVVGVMPPDFFLYQRHELWTAWQMSGELAGTRDTHFPSIVRLRPGVTAQRAQAEAETAFRAMATADVHKGYCLRLASLSDQVTGPVRPALLVALGAVGFVLLIACLNVANLLLARSMDRRGELALRAALGAGRMRIVRQLLTESLLLAVLGGAAGLLVAAWFSHTLVAAFPGRIPVPRLDQSRMDTGVLLFNLALSLATGLAFGLLPAFHASRLNLSETIKEGGRGASSGAGFRRLRNLLVVAETALSVVLLAGAGLMLRSFDKLLGIHPGFNPESVLTLRVPLPVSIKEKPRQAAYYSRMLERVQRLPGLNAAGLITPLPLGDVDANATFAVEGRPAPAGERQLVKLRAVSTGYFRAMGVGLRRGRLFSESDGAEAPAVVVVNESLARRYFPMEDPLGRRVGLSGSPKGPWFTIVGVVNDVKYMNLRDDGSPEMYRDHRQFLFAPFAVTLALRTGADDPMRLAATVQKEIRAVNPDQPITDVKSMRQVISENVSQPRFYTLLLSIFAAMAVLLAAAGLYGVLAHAVSGRVREIGIRIVLGASPRAILGQVVGHALALVAAGIGIGLAAACALTRLIAAQLFQISPTDPLTFTGVSVVLAAVAAVASFLPARRAVTVNPVAALRCQ